MRLGHTERLSGREVFTKKSTLAARFYVPRSLLFILRFPVLQTRSEVIGTATNRERFRPRGKQQSVRGLSRTTTHSARRGNKSAERFLWTKRNDGRSGRALDTRLNEGQTSLHRKARIRHTKLGSTSLVLTEEDTEATGIL